MASAVKEETHADLSRDQSGNSIAAMTRKPRTSSPFMRGMASIFDGMASIMDFGQSTRHRDRMLAKLRKGPEPWLKPPGPRDPDRPWPWP